MNPSIISNKQDVMGFLNEIQLDYPEAISFSSGRPDESCFNVESIQTYLETFKSHVKTSDAYPGNIAGTLGQYNRTRGIINDLVAKQMEKELKICVLPEHVFISVGAQEAIQLVINTMVDRDNERIAIENPAYIGVTGYAELMGYSLEAIPVGTDGMDLNNLEAQLKNSQEIGKKISLVCTIPDFHNPTGVQMSLGKRFRLLELADMYDFFILEDNAYGTFNYSDSYVPALKSLDKSERVIYIHSYSKIVFPGLRLAAVVADGALANGGSRVINGLLKMKNYTTVNTPSITQAILGGLLIQENFDLSILNLKKVELLKSKRDLLLKALETHLGEQHEWASEISWQAPKGGFFLMIKLPFFLDLTDVETLVRDYGVIICLKSFFEISPPENSDEIRLAFSYVNKNQIDNGIQRLANYLKNQMKEELQKEVS